MALFEGWCKSEWHSVNKVVLIINMCIGQCYVQYARDGFSYIFALLHGIKECDIHLSDILSSDFYCTLLLFYTIELICCLITYLQQIYLPVYIIIFH
jgi:hypothetical protein